ncbi:TPA_asm: glycoprotein [Bombay duck fish bornavirus]|uniref:Glycoprotein n=1 Tax=Bombay duck fish bornavirus TaxID=3067899 RepID=A0AA48SKB9_9MONO|nr:TPA_asm: glycoprotein [Bombay duck fish bornavirus]
MLGTSSAILVATLSTLIWPTSGFKAHRCETTSTPSSIRLDPPAMPPPPQNLTCSVTYKTPATTEALRARVKECRLYITYTSWGVFQQCTQSYKLIKQSKGCVQSDNFPSDPCEDWWYRGDSHPDIWAMSRQHYKTEVCICTPEEDVTLALSSVSPHLHCSFDDCSTCSPMDVTSGTCLLRSGLELSFTGKSFTPNSEEEDGSYVFHSTPPHIMVPSVHASFPLTDWEYKDDQYTIKCEKPVRGRTKRDTTQQYILDLIQRDLGLGVEAHAYTNLLWGMAISQPLHDYTSLIRAVLRRQDVTGTTDGRTLVYWPCEEVEGVSFRGWDNATLYPPVERVNWTGYFHPRTGILYETSPPAPPHLYMLIRVEEESYLGSTGSGQKPALIHSPRTTGVIEKHSSHKDALVDLRTSVHFTDPTFYAVGRLVDEDALMHEVTVTSLTHSMSTAGGFGWVDSLTPWSGLLGLYLQVAHLGGFLFVTFAVATLAKKCYHFIKYGRFALVWQPEYRA